MNNGRFQNAIEMSENGMLYINYNRTNFIFHESKNRKHLKEPSSRGNSSNNMSTA